MVELRDYEINRFVKYKQTIKIIIGSEYMIFTPSELKKGRVTNTQKSIYNAGQTYKLVGFRWKPEGRMEEQLTIDLSVKQRLAQEFREKYL